MNISPTTPRIPFYHLPPPSIFPSHVHDSSTIAQDSLLTRRLTPNLVEGDQSSIPRGYTDLSTSYAYSQSGAPLTPVSLFPPHRQLPFETPSCDLQSGERNFIAQDQSDSQGEEIDFSAYIVTMSPRTGSLVGDSRPVSAAGPTSQPSFNLQQMPPPAAEWPPRPVVGFSSQRDASNLNINLPPPVPSNAISTSVLAAEVGIPFHIPTGTSAQVPLQPSLGTSDISFNASFSNGILPPPRASERSLSSLSNHSPKSIPLLSWNTSHDDLSNDRDPSTDGNLRLPSLPPMLNDANQQEASVSYGSMPPKHLNQEGSSEVANLNDPLKPRQLSLTSYSLNPSFENMDPTSSTPSTASLQSTQASFTHLSHPSSALSEHLYTPSTSVFPLTTSLSNYTLSEHGQSDNNARGGIFGAAFSEPSSQQIEQQSTMAVPFGLPVLGHVLPAALSAVTPFTRAGPFPGPLSLPQAPSTIQPSALRNKHAIHQYHQYPQYQQHYHHLQDLRRATLPTSIHEENPTLDGTSDGFHAHSQALAQLRRASSPAISPCQPNQHQIGFQSNINHADSMHDRQPMAAHYQSQLYNAETERNDGHQVTAPYQHLLLHPPVSTWDKPLSPQPSTIFGDQEEEEEEKASEADDDKDPDYNPRSVSNRGGLSARRGRGGKARGGSVAGGRKALLTQIGEAQLWSVGGQRRGGGGASRGRHPRQRHRVNEGNCLNVVYTDEAEVKQTIEVKRKCHNCDTRDPPSWRKSILAEGKILCNKCGIYERTHRRARPPESEDLKIVKARSSQSGDFSTNSSLMTAWPAAANSQSGARNDSAVASGSRVARGRLRIDTSGEGVVPQRLGGEQHASSPGSATPTTVAALGSQTMSFETTRQLPKPPTFSHSVRMHNMASIPSPLPLRASYQPSPTPISPRQIHFSSGRSAVGVTSADMIRGQTSSHSQSDSPATPSSGNSTPFGQYTPMNSTVCPSSAASMNSIYTPLYHSPVYQINPNSTASMQSDGPHSSSSLPPSNLNPNSAPAYLHPSQAQAITVGLGGVYAQHQARALAQMQSRGYMLPSGRPVSQGHQVQPITTGHRASVGHSGMSAYTLPHPHPNVQSSGHIHAYNPYARPGSSSNLPMRERIGQMKMGGVPMGIAMEDGSETGRRWSEGGI